MASLVLFFTQNASASVLNNLSVQISPNGDVPAVTLACTTGRNYTLSLVHRTGDLVHNNKGVVERKYCADGTVTFSAFNLNTVLTTQIDPIWWRWVYTPLEYIIKDSTHSWLLSCDEIDCPLINLSGAFNDYDKSVYLASSTFWTTVGAGPIFDTTDNLTWFNAADGGVIPPPPPPPPEEPTYSSILFLPGIKASRLYKTGILNCSVNCEDQLWEPNTDSDVSALYMNTDGKSQDDSVYTRDVVDEAYGTFNIYKSFLAKLEEMKTEDETIADYSAVPYDWRLSFSDILSSGTKTGQNIYYAHATTSPYIISELARLASTSRNGKVTIIAHSNGGLLAKALLQKLADTGNPLLSKIDKLILVAVPQLGTPTAIASLLHGYKEHIPPGIPLALTDHTAREFGNNLPGAYQLLPSADYFTYVDTPVVTFDASTTPEWISRYGTTIHSEERLHNFLTDTYGRVGSESNNTATPTYLRENLLSASENAHNTLDAWTPPAGLEVVEIAGWGIPTTMSGVRYYIDDGKVKFKPTWTIDGDGTVVTPSALWSNGMAGVSRYWVDLKKYNNDHWISTGFGLSPINHGNIFEIEQIQDFIENAIFLQSTTTLQTYISTSTPIAESTNTRLIYSLHSPLTLDIYDNLGNHTGISTTTGQIEEQIPGTYYIQLGDEKYIFTDSSTPSHIVMNGYASGTFTFNIDQMRGDELTASTTFKNIPTSSSTRVSLDVSSDITTLSPMNIDRDGDGATDVSLLPKINDIVTLDSTPPVTVATTTGTEGKNGWFTSDVSVTLLASDTESPVSGTMYSQNGIWNSYTSPFAVSSEGTTTIQYFSIDSQGNREVTSTLVLHIDKTAPEAFIAFDPIRQKLSVSGRDALGDTTVSEGATSYVLTDSAGHTLQILFTQPKLKARRTSLSITKLIYDDVDKPASATLKYKWSANNAGVYNMFAMYGKTETTVIESHFRPKKKWTTLMTKPVDLDDGDNDDDSDNRPQKTKLPGMVVVGLTTDKGDVKINY